MIFYVDGWMQGKNPCTRGGFTVVNEHNELIAHEAIAADRITNLHVEILAIAYGAFHALPHDTVITDCQPAWHWAHNGYAKARPDLNKIAIKACQWITDKKLTLLWEPRETNLAGHFNERIDRSAK